MTYGFCIKAASTLKGLVFAPTIKWRLTKTSFWRMPVLMMISGNSNERGRRSGALTAREEEILDLAGKGFTDKQIGATLGISRDTVASYWRRILLKYSASSRTEVVAKAALSAANDHQSTEAALEGSLTFKRSLLHHMATAVVHIAPNGYVDFINVSAKSLLQADLENARLTPTAWGIVLAGGHQLFKTPESYFQRLTELIELEESAYGDVFETMSGSWIQQDFTVVREGSLVSGFILEYRQLTGSIYRRSAA